MSLEKIKSDSLIKKDFNSAIDKIRELKKQKYQDKNMLFLLDVSGSMSGYLEDGQSKLTHLLNAVEPYPNAQYYSFSDHVWDGITRTPQSNTDMTQAFQYVKSNVQDLSNKIFILVSDGMPDDSNSAFQEGLSLNVPIYIIFIGRKGWDGQEFMERLANATSGKYFTADTKSELGIERQIEEHIKEIKMLTEGKK